MSVLPTSLALTSIADGALETAADHRNNYAAIQTEANALLTILAGGAAGQVLTGAGTSLSWVYAPGHLFGYKEQTTSVSGVVATTFGAGSAIVTADAFTFDGSTAVWIEFQAEGVSNTVDGNKMFFDISDGGTSIATIGVKTAGAAASSDSILVKRKITPTAGAHTYSIVGYVSAGSGTVTAGAGGVSTTAPAHIAIYQA